VIGKICPRGDNLAGLIRYLYGPGRHEEHTDPHIIAGYRDPADLEPGQRLGGGRDFRRLVGLLKLPHEVLGSYGCARSVWHSAVRAAPEDRMLSDAEWVQISRDVMHRTGLSPHGEEDDAVRWIAVRHGPDHVHIVAVLARQDRARVSTWNDRYRLRDACLAAEQRYRLRSTAPADRTADRYPTRAETAKSARTGRVEPPRITLRRQVATAAASAGSAQEFFACLDRAGVQVRVRYSTKNPGQVTGYSVSLPGDTTAAGGQVWYGGGKLAADLSWPGLTDRWASPHPPDPRLTATERQRLWEYAARVTSDASEQIRAWSATNPAAVSDAAYAAGDTLRVTAAALGSSVLRQAADSFDRAAREQYGRIPAPTPVGNRLRQTARLISAYADLTHDPTFAPLLLIIRLAALAEAVAELRQAQQRTAQAGAAFAAARYLQAAGRPRWSMRAGGTAEPQPGRPGRPPAERSRLTDPSFPSSPFEPGQPPAPAHPRPGSGAPNPPRQPSPPRPRGPTC
jgi:hypothetical protein